MTIQLLMSFSFLAGINPEAMDKDFNATAISWAWINSIKGHFNTITTITPLEAEMCCVCRHV